MAALGVAAYGASSISSAATPTTATAFLAPLRTTTTIASTVPGNGDVNPYGIVRVSQSTGRLHAGDLLISNFNDKANQQGTGTTIMAISPAGKRSLFATISASSLPGKCPGGVGLTTALALLPGGDVVVGSLPTTNGKSATANVGCLIVLGSNGKPLSTIAGPKIGGPWDMTSMSKGDESTLFVSNALIGGPSTGVQKNSTVLRIDLKTVPNSPPGVLSEQVIAQGIPRRVDPEALVIGPTGLALAKNGTLYLADTLSNRIAAIPQALTRSTAVQGGGATVTSGGKLRQPLGLALAPNGDILAANAGNGNIVETTPTGVQLLARTANKETGAGSLFGLLVSPSGKGVFYVDDGANTLRLLH
jgi:hypothetical protein